MSTVSASPSSSLLPMTVNQHTRKPNSLPSFRQQASSFTSLNVPTQYQLPVTLLRVLSLLPSGIGLWHNFQRAWEQPQFDDTGLFENKTTPLIFCVASLWCVLAGYWSWVFTSSMLRRWLYHDDMSNALVRLIALTVINWSVAAFIAHYYGPDQPMWKWMTCCFVLLVCNVFKIMFASNTRYSPKQQYNAHPINLKSTAVKILVLPLFFVVMVTMFASLHQVSELRSRGDVRNMTAVIQAPKLDGLADASVRVVVIILSAWTPKSLDKRQTFRETTLTLMPKNNPNISYFYKFVIGQPPNDVVQKAMGPKIDKELAEHNDVLILNCSDKYEDLSKKVYSSMEWANQHDFDYFLKTDDDIFVRWDTISNELQALGRKTRYWQGLSYWNVPPIRNNQNKNSELQYPLPLFPPYTAGALYILSRDVISLIARGPRQFVKNEDQNLGVWLFAYNIQPILDRRIQQIDVCEEDMIAKHFGDFGDAEALGGTMYDMLDNLKSGRPMCTGFRSVFCGLCYPCHGKVNHWRDWNFDCDPVKGVTLLQLPQLTMLE